MSNAFEKIHLPVEEEEEDYDEPQPWMDEFEYIDWLISHR